MRKKAIVMKTINCPRGHGPMVLKRVKKKVTFRGVNIAVEAEAYVCRECGLEAGTPQTAGALQRAVADAYRSRQGLSTNNNIAV